MEKKNIVFATIALVVICIFLFKDTITHFFNQNRPSKTIVSEERASLQRLPSRPVSPLSKVLAAIDSRDGSGGVVNVPSGDSPQDALLEKPATWPMLQKGQYREILASARNRSLIIASQINTESIRSRYALYNFSAGVDFVLSQPSNVLSAPEAMAYLQDLHLKVTRALEEDGVKSNIYKTWRDVSLDASRAVDNMKEGDYKLGSTINLSLFLTKVSTRKNSPMLRVRGAVNGQDIDRIEIYKNGIFQFDVFKGKKRKDTNPFYFRDEDGRGVWAIRVVSKNGNFLEKRYRFISYIGGPANSSPYATKSFIVPRDWTAF